MDWRKELRPAGTCCVQESFHDQYIDGLSKEGRTLDVHLGKEVGHIEVTLLLHVTKFVS